MGDQNMEQQVRERAYELWEQNGSLHGHAEEHWHQAERELASTDPEQEPVEEAQPVKRPRRITAKAKDAAEPTASTAPPKRRAAAAPSSP